MQHLQLDREVHRVADIPAQRYAQQERQDRSCDQRPREGPEGVLLKDFSQQQKQNNKLRQPCEESDRARKQESPEIALVEDGIFFLVVWVFSDLSAPEGDEDKRSDNDGEGKQ
jgi:hypothetical protein